MASSSQSINQRHYCIVLTNNRRMIQSAQRLLSNKTGDALNEQSSQTQQQQQSLPLSPLHVQAGVQLQHLNSTMETPSNSQIVIQQQIEQQVPIAIPHATAVEIMALNARAYEKEIEADFQAQIQPILQSYLQRTRRSSPINSVFDMSTYIQI